MNGYELMIKKYFRIDLIDEIFFRGSIEKGDNAISNWFF